MEKEGKDSNRKGLQTHKFSTVKIELFGVRSISHPRHRLLLSLSFSRPLKLEVKRVPERPL